jgi:endonuclease/exonuclease/phosphatase family metal-dependent hydrolase
MRDSSLLVVLVTATLVEVMRVSFPLLYDFAGEIGFTTAAAVIPVLFATTLVAAPLGALVGPRMLLLVSATGLAVARLTMQVQDTPALAITFVGLALGLIAISTALRVSVARIGPLTSGSAIFLGLVIDTAIRLALVTWDAAWRNDAAGWIIGCAMPVALIAVLVVVLMSERDARWGADLWWFAVLPGPVLALQTLFLSNPGFVASSGGLGLAMSGAVVLLGLGLAAATPALRAPGAWAAWAALVLAAGLLTGPTGLTGWPVPFGVLVGQVAMGALVATAAVRAEAAGEDRQAWRTGLGAGVSALVLVAVLLPYQISYEIPLGVPQFVFPVVGALAVVLLARTAPTAAAAPATRVSPMRWLAALGPIPALLVPAWLALTWPDVQPPAEATRQVRVATYNIHGGVDWYGRLDPEAIARVLENGGAEVIMLQEVARGWPLAGGLDSAAYLARRLGADFSFGTAADHQFGNAVLADRPILDSWSATMDRGEGPMQRGYVGVTLALGESTLDVWSVHLQHQDDTTATRVAQARQLLGEWANRERTVIGGDLNARPDSADIAPWFDGTGLVSAQDVAGDPAWNTSPALNPDHRIDWIFGTPDLEFADVAIPVTLASDHLPVFATVRVN